MSFASFTKKTLTDLNSVYATLLAVAKLQADAGVQADVSGIIADINSFGLPIPFTGIVQGVIAAKGAAVVDGLTKLIDLNNKIIAALPTPPAAAPAPAQTSGS